MKKTLTLFLVLMFSLLAHAQNHMKFSGIEITGSKTEFVKKLQQKGYKLVRYTNNGAIMTGVFAGSKATVNIAENQSGNVFCVYVDYVQTTQWKELEKQYSYYKELYTNKYGEPYKVEERNKWLFASNNDTKMMGICEDGTWECYFRTKSGHICISLEGKTIKKQYSQPIYKGNVRIIYEDDSNTNVINDKFRDEI